jgi:hypothetical protein
MVDLNHPLCSALTLAQNPPVFDAFFRLSTDEPAPSLFTLFNHASTVADSRSVPKLCKGQKAGFQGRARDAIDHRWFVSHGVPMEAHRERFFCGRNERRRLLAMRQGPKNKAVASKGFRSDVMGKLVKLAVREDIAFVAVPIRQKLIVGLIGVRRRAVLRAIRKARLCSESVDPI